MIDVEVTKKNKPVKSIKIPNTIGCMILGASLMAAIGSVSGVIVGVIYDVKNIVNKFTKK